MEQTQIFDTTNQEMQNAYNLIARTNKSFFLTGRAGTGKTTFLKNIRKHVGKKFIVLAPSGIAAINAGGQTIHSFFGFNFSVQGPLSYGKMNSNKISIVQNVDTIILDEVSMVRCDIIDAIDRTLRECRHSSLPFGGIQMVFVGDLFQLPPVITSEHRELIKQLYGDPSGLFYKANCLKDNPLPKIEFKKIYRQNDKEFIDLLERFRMGSVSLVDLMKINRNVAEPSKADDGEMRVTLTVYKEDAKLINETRLEQLPGDTWKYEANYNGNASKLKDVVEDLLELKVGAQVMFLRNDYEGRWANGTIGRITSLDDDKIGVELSDGEEYIIERESWEAYDYQYDDVKKVCKQEKVGSVTQFPLRLAWAITIHKSQGLTFDKVAIDFGRGAFTFGQAYVALSRARSLDGLQLVRPIDHNSVRVSRDILSFASSYNDERVINTELAIGEAVREYEVAGDYDGAAARLFEMCELEANEGNVDYAFDLFTRAMSYVADDSCLFGRDWKMIPSMTRECIILNAAGLLYSGRTPEAIQMLLPLVSGSEMNFNCLYLLARGLEIAEDWDHVEELYDRMISIFKDMVGNGLDSSSFRKFKYRLAVLNEGHYGDPGVELMISLIAENPRYDKYHTDLRWMLHKHPGELNVSPAEDNPVLNAILDPQVSEEDFLATLHEHRDAKREEWRRYRRSLGRLKVKRESSEEEKDNVEV